MSTRVNITMAKLTEIPDLSWQLNDSGLIAGDQHKTEMGPLNMGDRGALSVCEVTDSGSRIYPSCIDWLFRVHSLWRDTVLSLDSLRRLDQASTWYVRPRDSLRTPTLFWGMGGGIRWKEGGRERVEDDPSKILTILVALFHLLLKYPLPCQEIFRMIQRF